MKKIKWLIVGLVVLTATISFGIPAELIDIVDSAFPQWFRAGVYVSPASVEPATANKVTRMVGGSDSLTFSYTDGGQCTLAGSMVATGAQPGDPCFVGCNLAPAANTALNCFVPDAGLARVQRCVAGSANSAALTDTCRVRIISAQ